MDNLNIPIHLAIIMDGNGRWAKQRNKLRGFGHKEGVKRVKDITKACDNLGIKYLTLYAFSTENWNRPQSEVDGLMDLLVVFLNKELKELHEKGVKITTIGDLSRLPEKPLKAVKNAIELTKNNKNIQLNIALNYGSRAEIVHAVKHIATDYNNQVERITEEVISKYLYTSDMPDPDFVIRTSGEIRLSNFLLYQLAYSEMYFTDVLWPDFKEEELIIALKEFSNRKRRFGKV